MTFDVRDFTYVRDFDLLVVDASDLGLNQLPNTFAVASPTGRVEHFHFESHQRDNEGEVTGWHFVSPNCPVSITVFND